MVALNLAKPKKRCPYYNTKEIADWHQRRYGFKIKFNINTSNQAKYRRYYAIFMNA